MVSRGEGEGDRRTRYEFDEDSLSMTDVSSTGKIVIDSLPENDDACNELLVEIAQYLPKRYPTLFREEVDGIFNMVTGEHHTELATKKGIAALQIISRYEY